MQQNLKDNITSPLLSSLSSSSTTTIFSLMQSILFQLKDHFISSLPQTNLSFLNDLFTLLHQLTTSYNQLTLSTKSKQAYIKSTNTVINTLKDTITSFISTHSHKPFNNINNTTSSFLNISSQITFSYTHGTPLPNENIINTQDSFLNCAELSNEDIINKIKQKIEKKNSDVNLQYNTIQVNQQQGSNTNAHHIFSPLKDNINTPIKGKTHRHVNVNRIKRGNTTTAKTMHEERSKGKCKCASAKRIVKKLPSHISVNLNLSIDKQQQQQQQRLNNSFNVYQQRRTYSLPNNNNNLRTSSNKLKKQNSHQIKEGPILSDITINTNTNNSVIQQDNKLNSPSIINDHNKVNSTFVCTFVRNGNTIQKYTLNTKANQNVPRASHYANYLLSKYKGVIAAYNEGQGKN